MSRSRGLITYAPAFSSIGIRNDKARKAITIELNGNASYIPLTAQKLEALKAECLAALGPQYTKYKISLKSDGHTLDQLALFGSSHTLPRFQA